MFTGLVETCARVVRVVEEPPGRRLVIARPKLSGECCLGDSIAISGCCLTVVSLDDHEWAFQAGPETLLKTTLGTLAAGSTVNLERSLKIGDQLGGHFVTGHVDGVGTLQTRQDEGDWSLFRFAAPSAMTPQMASKGSIAVDGVSLTLVDVGPDFFTVALIPHTLDMTTLGSLQTGSRVNLETDLLAKYVQRQLCGAE
jgi:riboflavin synthase